MQINQYPTNRQQLSNGIEQEQNWESAAINSWQTTTYSQLGNTWDFSFFFGLPWGNCGGGGDEHAT